MSRHEGVSCDSCLKGNFRGRRYKCLICYDYDLCAGCYEAGATTTRHTTEHPMQCILTRADFELYYGGEALSSVEQPQAYTCPYCNRMGFTDNSLQEHVTSEHSDISFEVVCPVCASVPGGDPNLMTDDFAGHLTLEHRSGPRDLISFLDEPVSTRHNVRRMPHTSRGVAGTRSRRSNMHFSSSGGLSSLSPSSRDNVDPIAELLSQLSGVRRSATNASVSATTPSQLQQLQMQLQLERQQVARQQLERLPRRQLQTTVTGGSTQTQATVLREPVNSSTAQPGPVTTATVNNGLLLNNFQTAHLPPSHNSQFLLSRLLEELPPEPAMEEQRAERSMFVQQLLLSTITESDTPVATKLKQILESRRLGSHANVKHDISQKIAIPNNTKLNCLAWNREDGYIAVGGENGLLKVLKLDAAGGENDTHSRSRGLIASSNLSMNQTLEGHTENIQVITWNESHRKLTTSDQNGVIIVWMIYKNAWYEEMINNRKKSTVVGMAWSSDGLKICIIYEDGAVIVGSVDGNRIWGKELKGILLAGVQWSPDGKFLLFTLRNGEVHLYDNQGNFTMRLEIHCINSSNEQNSVVGLDWYDGKFGYAHAVCPCLVICYENGKMQLMINETDTDPITVDTSITAVHCRWNHNGSLLAVAGYQIEEDKASNVVRFYNPFGELIRTLKVPGKNISCCEWEGGSLRVALAVDSFVYFANIRPDYKWCYFKKTIVFTTCRPQKAGICVSFWDTTNNQCHTRYVPELIALAGYGDHCVLVIKSETEDNGKFGLLLCNTLGTPTDGKYTDIEIQWVTMNSSHVIAASKDHFLLWQYRTPKVATAGGNRGKYRLYHIDDSPSGAVEVIRDFDEMIEEQVNIHSSSNPICCLTASDKCLIVGRENGILQHYALSHVALVNKYKLNNSRPHKIAINCNSTRLAIIDVTGLLTMIELSEHAGQVSNTENETSKLERKDVWTMCWASDNPQLLAVMEKTRMYVFKGVYPEEPMASSGYICCFQDLEIQAVLLDDIMDTPERPSKDHLICLEVKSLRDTRQLLDKVGINEAAQFIEDNPHPRLWRLLAEAAVRKLNLVTAESAFIRSLDYPGIQFIKKLQEINCEQVKKAVIATYFKEFDEAEKLFLDSDRRDLALNLRQILGDWFRVIQIMKMGVRGSDIQMENTWNAIGNYFYDRRNWEGAREYYEKARNIEMLIKCYYALEDFDALEAIIETVSERHSLLLKIAEMFVTVGLCNQAVAAYSKYGDIYSAVNLCVKLNEWDLAISLAKQSNLPQISDILSHYAKHLMSKNCLGEAVELFLKANRFLEAAKIVYQLADIEAKKHTNALKVKKLYVYAALLVEEHVKIMNSAFKDHTLIGEATDDLEIIENAWHGAEGYHLLALVHSYLHDGQLHSAMIASLKLREFEDVIPTEELFCLLAVTSCLNNSFGVCSKALIKLESLEELTVGERQEYEEIAVNIFTKHGLKDYHVNRIECPKCETLISDWSSTCPTCYTEFPTCMVSGRPLTDITRIWTCPICKHSSSERDITLHKSCPLCHSLINY